MVTMVTTHHDNLDARACHVATAVPIRKQCERDSFPSEDMVLVVLPTRVLSKLVMTDDSGKCAD